MIIIIIVLIIRIIIIVIIIRMERSAEERTKYPDRINLDRRGLHGIPLLADEPGLRLLRLMDTIIICTIYIMVMILTKAIITVVVWPK